MALPARRWALLCLVVLGSACAASRALTRSGGRDANIISQEELRQNAFRNGYDAVQALRPDWLEPGGAGARTAGAGMLVYLDDILMGDVETLRNIDMTHVVYIEHFDARAASARWNIGGGQEAIDVSTHPGPPAQPRAEHAR